MYLNNLAGKHGIGRIDHVENRMVGIKSREIYETPGAEVLLKAHKALETITLTKDVAHFKPVIEKQFSEQIYNGLWFSPLTDSLKLFIDSTQQYVEGDVRVKLFKGNAIVNGRQSPYTLYDEKLAYTEDAFNQEAAVGFIDIYGLPTQVNAMLHGGYSNEQKAWGGRFEAQPEDWADDFNASIDFEKSNQSRCTRQYCTCNDARESKYYFTRRSRGNY